MVPSSPSQDQRLRLLAWPVRALFAALPLAILFAAWAGTVPDFWVHVLLLAAGAVLAYPLGRRAPALALSVGSGLAAAACCTGRALRNLYDQLRQVRLGPLYFYELVRLARRRRTPLLRFTYTLLLTSGLYLVYANRFPNYDLLADPFAPATAVAAARVQFVQLFVLAVLILQCAAVVVLTPAYLAGALAEEKEKRTLELLFTTHLTDHEIVLGKLFARLTHLGCILLAGLPILSLLQFWGGLQPELLFVGFAVTGLTLLSVGSLSILCSVFSRDVVRATLSSYAVVAFVTIGWLPASPFFFLAQLEKRTGVGALNTIFSWPVSSTPALASVSLEQLLAIYAMAHGLVAMFCCAFAIARLRGDGSAPVSRAQAAPVWGGWQPAPAVQGWDPVQPGHAWEQETKLPEIRRRVSFPVTDQSLLWKEMYHGAGEFAGWSFRSVYLATVLIGLGVLLAIFVGTAFTSPPQAGQLSVWFHFQHVRDDIANRLVRAVVAALMGAWCVCVALRAAASVSREREQQTLLGLLTLPVDRATLLEAKSLGTILRYRHFGYVLAGVLTLGVLTGALHPLALPLLLLAGAAHVLFLANLGVWLSLACRKTLSAQVSMMLVLLLLLVGWLVLLAYSQLLGVRPDQMGWRGRFIEWGLNPAGTWWYLAFSWEQFATDVLAPQQALPGRYGATLAGLLVFALSAWALWRAACARMAREQLVTEADFRRP